MTPWYILMTASAGVFWGLACFIHGRFRGRAVRVLEVMLGLAGSTSAASSVLASFVLPYEALGAPGWLIVPVVGGQWALMALSYRRVEAVIG